MRFFFFIVPAFIFIPVCIYYYRFFSRFFSLFHIMPKTKGSRILSLLAILIILWCSLPVYGLGAVITLHFLAACVIMEVIHKILTSWCFKKQHKYFEILYKSGVIAAAAVSILLLYGYWNIHQITQKDYTLSSEKIQKENPLRIALITDLHLGTTMNADEFEAWSIKIEEEKPDLLLLGGDIFDESTTLADMQRAVEIFGNMDSRLGTYYVFGNHDSNLYVDQPMYTKQQLRETLNAAGVHVLEDETVKLEGNYVLIGRQDASTGNRAGITDLMKEVSPSSFTILLDHQPVEVLDNETSGVDLQLGGHTHAGQIWPTGPLMQLFGVNDLNYGYMQKENLQMIVSSGIAGWGYPVRTGGHSEYVIIDLKNNQG